ncbi:hypothetical protein ERX37_04920 [Macrococcus hajekii]|uniref:Uncharacterized protein n=1 Tax=Macrococcus hajekii TaxID=198482 RepID=A0A4R6BNI8_9STAP|nr:hypothetical protein [Macrococcus hajekii]TDM03429.1 hypothetical protein ERX37_04920 [Macrococcus hajekii]GGA98796.1 UPF0738 protein [Macrococcus hajekii]
MNLHVNEIKLVDDQVHVFTAEEPLDQLTATGQMITDSDHFQFVYQLDDGTAYQHLRFVEETWPMMNDYKDKEWLLYGTVKLERFTEEFELLLDNIKDNHNYGKAFTEKVEEVFAL